MISFIFIKNCIDIYVQEKLCNFQAVSRILLGGHLPLPPLPLFFFTKSKNKQDYYYLGKESKVQNGPECLGQQQERAPQGWCNFQKWGKNNPYSFCKNKGSPGILQEILYKEIYIQRNLRDQTKKINIDSTLFFQLVEQLCYKKQ